jgi:hypothetical protein
MCRLGLVCGGRGVEGLNGYVVVNGRYNNVEVV